MNTSPKYIINKVKEHGVINSLRIFLNKIKKVLYKYIGSPYNIVKEYYFTFYDGIRYKREKESDILYAFYDFNYFPATFDITKFALFSEYQRKKQGISHVHFVFVPSIGGLMAPDDQVKNYHESKAQQWQCDDDYPLWVARNVVFPCCWLVPSCNQVTVCGTRDEALALRYSKAEHIFPLDYSVRVAPDNYKVASKMNVKPVDWAYMGDPILDFDELPTLAAKPQALLYVDEWLTIHNIDRKKIITITLRERTVNPVWNTKLDEWAKVVNYLSDNNYFVVILRDAEMVFQPLSKKFCKATAFGEPVFNMELRMALYELSYINLFPSGGPNCLCKVNKKARSITFPPSSSMLDHWYFRGGINEQSNKFPLTSERHRLVQKEDLYDNIIPAFEEFSAEIEKREGKSVS